MRAFRRSVAFCAVVAAVVCCLAATGSEAADDYPKRTIKIIVASTAGAGTDVMARVIAGKLQPVLGQPVIVENRPGGGGLIAGAAVKNSDPDGYTLLFGHQGSMVTSPLMSKAPPYNPTKDFAAVAAVYMAVSPLVSHGAFAPKTMGEIIQYARNNPGKLNYASAGTGTLGHLWAEQLKKAAGIDVLIVKYPGVAPATRAIISGEAQFGLSEMNTMGGYVNSAELRVIAQIGTKRVSSLPNVPTVREAGFPELEGEFWFGLVAPSGTPASIVERLNREVNAVMASDEIKNVLKTTGGEALSGPPKFLEDLIVKDYKQYEPIIQQLGLVQ